MLKQSSLFYWNGPQTKLLRERFQEYYPQDYVMSCSSGTSDVHIAVAAAGIGPIWSQIVQRLPSSSAASLLYLIPILSFALAWLFLREAPSTPSFVGGAIVLLGVAIVNWRL